MAGIFTDEQKEAIQAGANSTVQLFKDRFHEKQFNDFLQNEYAEYNNAIRQVQATVLSADLEKDPEALKTAFMGYTQAQNGMFTAAAKYRDNPKISDLANRHMEHDKNMFALMTTAEQYGHERGRRGVLEGQADEKHDVGIESAEAGIEHKKASTDYIKGPQTELTRAQADKAKGIAGNTQKDKDRPPIFLMQDAGNPEDLVALAKESGNPQGLSQIHSFVSASLNRRDKRWGPTLQAEEAAIKRELARQFLRRQVDAGAEKSRGEKWKLSEEDIQQAMWLVDDEAVRRQHLSQRLMTEAQNFGYTAQDVADSYPDLYPSFHKKSPTGVPALGGVINKAQAAERMFGSPAQVVAQSLGFDKVTDIVDTNKVVSRIKKASSWTELGDPTTSPLAAPFATLIQTGGYDPSKPEQKFETTKELYEYLQQYGEELVRANVGGQEYEDKDLSASAREARADMRKIFNAVVEKFGPDLAREIGIKDAPKQKKTWQGILAAPGWAARQAGRLLPDKD